MRHKNERDAKPDVQNCPNPGANIICLRCFGVIESKCKCGLVIWTCTCEYPRPSNSVDPLRIH